MKTLLVTLSLLLLAAPNFATQTTRIIGGQALSQGDAPHQVALISNLSNPYQTQSCGGSLIAEQWVLTAAHCYNPDTTSSFIATDILNLSEANQGSTAEVDHWILHPNFNEITMNNDIALIKLKTPIDITSCTSCAAIELVTPSTITSMANGLVANVSGWGNVSTSTNNFPDELRAVDVHIMSCSQSPSLYPASEITSNMFCAGDTGKDSCQGDSGGPITVTAPSGLTQVLAGIVSWGNACAQAGYPGVYTKVPNYVNWIFESTDGAAGNAVSGQAGSGSNVISTVPGSTSGSGSGSSSGIDSSLINPNSSGAFGIWALLASPLLWLTRRNRNKAIK